MVSPIKTAHSTESEETLKASPIHSPEPVLAKVSPGETLFPSFDKAWKEPGVESPFAKEVFTTPKAKTTIITPDVASEAAKTAEQWMQDFTKEHNKLRASSWNSQISCGFFTRSGISKVSTLKEVLDYVTNNHGKHSSWNLMAYTANRSHRLLINIGALNTVVKHLMLTF